MERVPSSVSRRNLVIGAGAAAVAAMVAAPKLFPGAERGTRRLLASNSLTRGFLSLADASHAEWAAQVGSVFTVDGGYRLKLAGIRPLQSGGARPAGLGRDRAFLAVFDVLGGLTMPGDLIYGASHAQYGALPLFLSATGESRQMFAVFN